jgi:pimeloyl-ACP methyl ester carboxylesterase
MANPIFRSAAAEEKYLKAYADSLTLWPVPLERFDVPGRFGSTHVIAAGPASAPPLILLHGMGVSSTSWYANIEALSRIRRCYALDYPGDVNCSVCTQPLRTRQDAVEWITGVLDGLKVERADFVGLSYGGFLAMNYVSKAPARVRRAIALCPAAVLTSIRAEFVVRLAALMFYPTPAVRKSFSHWMLGERYRRPPLLEGQFFAGLQGTRTLIRLRPVAFSDDELRGIRPRVLVLTGDCEVLCDAQAVVRRARALIPYGEAESYANAGHALPLELPGPVNEHLIRFLTA